MGLGLGLGFVQVVLLKGKFSFWIWGLGFVHVLRGVLRFWVQGSSRGEPLVQHYLSNTGSQGVLGNYFSGGTTSRGDFRKRRHACAKPRSENDDDGDDIRGDHI